MRMRRPCNKIIVFIITTISIIIIIIILPGDLVTRSSKLFPVVATDSGSAKGALFRIIMMITMVKLMRMKWKETKESSNNWGNFLSKERKGSDHKRSGRSCHTYDLQADPWGWRWWWQRFLMVMMKVAMVKMAIAMMVMRVKVVIMVMTHLSFLMAPQ